MNAYGRRVDYHFCEMKTHQDLITWLCTRARGLRGNLVYLGDRELILGKLATWNDKNTRCVVENENAAENLTYEPYALLVSRTKKSRNDEALTEFVQRRIYEFFSFRAKAVQEFETHFLGQGTGPPEDKRMSQALAYLFLLNGIREERKYAFPPDPPPQERDDTVASAP